MEVPVIEDEAMELGQLYRSSAVMDASDELPPALRPDQWNGQPGTRAPHVWVAVGGARISTLDLVQSGWVMLTEDTCWLAAAQAAVDSLELKLECVLIGGAVARSDAISNQQCT
nr:hypothetical protein [Marinicella sp. W31]MDC2875563.1 hypothetical protein [Marinicella sp. W31]